MTTLPKTAFDHHPIDPRCPINVTTEDELGVAQSQVNQAAEVLTEWFGRCAEELLEKDDEHTFTREQVADYVTWAVSYCLISASSEMAEEMLMDVISEKVEMSKKWRSLKK